jgi:ferrous iron transport protein B
VPIRVALAGNPNSGKTTLFNALTGSTQYVGNWPGVTVEKKEGRYRENKDVAVTDLPGVYSLSPYSPEEIITRNFLIEERPDVVINIIDGTNLQRNLFLTTQLTELGIPVAVAVNMMDMVQKSGAAINSARLAGELGCPVAEISALKGSGIAELMDAALAAASSGKACVPRHNFSGAVEHALAHIEEAALHHLPQERQRFYAIKLFERDSDITAKLGLTPEQTAHIEGDIARGEREAGDDSESVITAERYKYIDSIIKDCVTAKHGAGLTASDRIDAVLTNRVMALPLFALIMFAVYFLSVTLVGGFSADWISGALLGRALPGAAKQALAAVGCADWLEGLIVDGVIAGAGAVLGFLPQLLALFAFLGFLEQCGYMARIAFILDRVFRKFGLSGKSFIPILIGTGCGVPGIMAARAIENDACRKLTVITTTFIPCSAKLPVIALLSGALFRGAWWVAPSAYFAGIAAIICSGVILKKTKPFSGSDSPFIMELPAYHWPGAGAVLRHMWQRGWSFVKRAGAVIVPASVVIWFASGHGFTEGAFGRAEAQDSILAAAGGAVAWLFAPLGWGDWRPVTATLTGLAAKESIVATLGILYGTAEAGGGGQAAWSALSQNFSALSGYSFLLFNLLCAPCVAAMGAMRREMPNAKWFWFALLWQCGFAYGAALCVYRIGLLPQGSFGLAAAAALLTLGLFMYMLLRRPKAARRAR